MARRLTHLDAKGRARMVDVGAKAVTRREAVAKGAVRMKPATLRLIRAGGIGKGDVLAVARLAGIMAAKNTPELIPLAHRIQLASVEIDFAFDTKRSAVHVAATCRAADRTGVEMEALAAVTVSALAIYDMCKAVDRGMRVTDIRLTKKSGGKSGDYSAK